MMNRRLILLIGIMAGFLAGCPHKPKSQKEQVSYTIGIQFGKSLRSQNLDLDPKVVAQGIVDGIKGNDSELSDQDMQRAMERLTDERHRDMKIEADKNKVKASEFLTKNKTAEGVHVSPSGLQYKIINPGSGVAPQKDDLVVVNFKASLTDGTEFDSTYKRGTPAEFPIKGVIPGWTEGLMMLKKGGKATFWIPPELGYGDTQRQQIPANSVLIFDVELLDVKPEPKTSEAGPKAHNPTKKR